MWLIFFFTLVLLAETTVSFADKAMAEQPLIEGKIKSGVDEPPVNFNFSFKNHFEAESYFKEAPQDEDYKLHLEPTLRFTVSIPHHYQKIDTTKELEDIEIYDKILKTKQ